MNILTPATPSSRSLPASARDRAAEFASAVTAPVPEDGFPLDAVEALDRSGLLAAPLPRERGGCGLGVLPGTMEELLDVLRAVGRTDLSVGRLYEGHCNALQLIQQFGTADQWRRATMDTLAGHMFAVWNTQAAGGIELTDTGGGLVLDGEKSFCSGAGDVTRPLVTVSGPGGDPVLCLIRADELPMGFDLTAWKPLGMAASASGAIRIDGMAIEPGDLIGGPGDYHRQPWFSGGAIRFAAVQLGGAEALLEEVLDHLTARGRDGDPYQVARVGSMAVAVEGGRAWLARAAEAAEPVFGVRHPDPGAAAEAVHRADMVRTAIERICLDVMEHAVRCIGVSGLLKPHPLERRLRDLTTYLRQPAPDAALAAVGRRLLAARRDRAQ